MARHFIVVAEVGHFGRAAQRLHLTQSALTKPVQVLERQVGTVLIDRSRRPWRLTAAGQNVLALSLAATVAGALVAWARRQQRAAAHWAPSVQWGLRDHPGIQREMTDFPFPQYRCRREPRCSFARHSALESRVPVAEVIPPTSR